MDTWQFYQNDRGEWCWKHIAHDGGTLASDECFPSRTDCIADAMCHGYLARTSPGARRMADALPWWGAMTSRL